MQILKPSQFPVPTVVRGVVRSFGECAYLYVDLGEIFKKLKILPTLYTDKVEDINFPRRHFTYFLELDTGAFAFLTKYEDKNYIELGLECVDDYIFYQDDLLEVVKFFKLKTQQPPAKAGGLRFQALKVHYSRVDFTTRPPWTAPS